MDRMISNVDVKGIKDLALREGGLKALLVSHLTCQDFGAGVTRIVDQTPRL